MTNRRKCLLQLIKLGRSDALISLNCCRYHSIDSARDNAQRIDDALIVD
jgi:hypothetical protein